MAHRNNYIVFLVLHYILIVALFPTSFSLPRHHNYRENGAKSEAIPVDILSIAPSVSIENSRETSHYVKRTDGNQLSESKLCCPTNVEIVEPIAGKSRGGVLVELYQSESIRQRFYEISCDPSIAERPCQYLDPKHEAMSRCEQQYSYTYALVRDMSVDGSSSRNNRGWRLDYILIRSGCSCQIS